MGSQKLRRFAGQSKSRWRRDLHIGEIEEFEIGTMADGCGRVDQNTDGADRVTLGRKGRSKGQGRSISEILARSCGKKDPPAGRVGVAAVERAEPGCPAAPARGWVPGRRLQTGRTPFQDHPHGRRRRVRDQSDVVSWTLPPDLPRRPRPPGPWRRGVLECGASHPEHVRVAVGEDPDEFVSEIVLIGSNLSGNPFVEHLPASVDVLPQAMVDIV